MSPLKNKFNIEEPFSEKKTKAEESFKVEEELEEEILEDELITPDLDNVNTKNQEEYAIRQGEQGVIVDKGIRTTNGLKQVRFSAPLADDAEILVQTGTAGWGFAVIGDNQEYGQFTWTSAGVVTLVNNSANTVATDTDTKFCIYDAGSGIAIKNRLGSELTLRYELNYS